jgi:hypothetical protein
MTYLIRHSCLTWLNQSGPKRKKAEQSGTFCLYLMNLIRVQRVLSASKSASAPTASAAATVATTTATPVTAATTKTAASAARSTTKAAALCFGTGFIHVDIAGAQLSSVGPGNGFLCLFVICHFHKAKTPWLARIAVTHDCHIIDLSIRLESAPQFIFGDVVIQITDVDILH